MSNQKSFFTWKLYFPEIFQGNNPGFDIVIGNPPYVKEGTNRNAFDGLRDSPYYQGKMDLWYFFGCIALDIVKNNGVVSFIAPNNWITNDGASKFRNKVNEEGRIDCFIDFGNYKVFDAGIQTMIYLMRKNNEEKEFELNYSQLMEDDITKDQLIQFLYTDSNEISKKFKAGFNREMNKNEYLRFLEKDKYHLLAKIYNNNDIFFLDDNDVVQGIVPNPDKINIRNISKISPENIEKYDIKTGDGVFVVPTNFFEDLNNLEKSFIKPLYEPNELGRYFFPKSHSKEIIYLSTNNTANLDINKLPNLISHLKKYKEIMESRRENLNNAREFYHLHWPRDESFFINGAKILSVRKCSKPTFVYTEKEAYVMLSFNVIKSNKINLKVLASILNSNVVQFWLKYMGKMQGNNFQVDRGPLLKIPIIQNISEDIEKEIIHNVDLIMNSEENIDDCENRINKLIYGLYGLDDDDIQIIENNI